MANIRGNACLSWVDADDLSVERVLLLREPLREIRPAAVQTVYAADSLDFSQRVSLTIGQGVDELVGRVRFMDDPQGCIDLIKAGTKLRTVTYIPDLDDPTRSFACYLISPMLPNVVGMDAEMGTNFGLHEFEVRLRKTDGKAFDLGWVFEQGVLFRYRAAGRIKDAAYSRASTATYFDKFSILQTAISGGSRVEWVDTNSDGVRETPSQVLEATRTNVVIWNRDLTNAAWVKSGGGGVTAAKDQTGIDGVASSASRITASGANGTCLQTIALASSARYQSAWVKRLVGTGTINMTTDNGATWTVIVPTTSWSRLTIPTQTLANPIVGFRIVTNADSIAVDYVQNENGTFASSEIPTTTLAVTRAADALNFPFGYRPQALWVYAKWIERGTAQLADARIWAIGDAAFTAPYVALQYQTSGAGYRAIADGGSGVVTTSYLTAGAVGVVHESLVLLTSAGVVSLRLSVAGAADLVSTNSSASALGTAWNGAKRLYVGYGNGVTDGYTGMLNLVVGVGNAVTTIDQVRRAV